MNTGSAPRQSPASFGSAHLRPPPPRRPQRGLGGLLPIVVVFLLAAGAIVGGVTYQRHQREEDRKALAAKERAVRVVDPSTGYSWVMHGKATMRRSRFQINSGRVDAKGVPVPETNLPQRTYEVVHDGWIERVAIVDLGGTVAPNVGWFYWELFPSQPDLRLGGDVDEVRIGGAQGFTGTLENSRSLGYDAGVFLAQGADHVIVGGVSAEPGDPHLPGGADDLRRSVRNVR